MSVGVLCDCSRAEHGGGCRMYAENGRKGMCRSCNYGFHRPCHEIVLPIGEPYGNCLRCSWHSSAHEEPK